MRLLDELRAKRDLIQALSRRHGARCTCVFGSAARHEKRADSVVPSAVRRLIIQAFGKKAGCWGSGFGAQKVVKDTLLLRRLMRAADPVDFKQAVLRSKTT